MFVYLIISIHKNLIGDDDIICVEMIFVYWHGSAYRYRILDLPRVNISPIGCRYADQVHVIREIFRQYHIIQYQYSLLDRFYTNLSTKITFSGM